MVRQLTAPAHLGAGRNQDNCSGGNLKCSLVTTTTLVRIKAARGSTFSSNIALAPTIATVSFLALLLASGTALAGGGDGGGSSGGAGGDVDANHQGLPGQSGQGSAAGGGGGGSGAAGGDGSYGFGPGSAGTGGAGGTAAGADGAAGGDVTGTTFAGGGGGGGGAHGFMGGVVPDGSFRGGDGGRGGNAPGTGAVNTGGDGGGGGAGGYGAVVIGGGAGSVASGDSLTGGQGGVGGNARYEVGDGGDGGAGLAYEGATLTIEGNLAGGAGGAGDSGGNGGAGLIFNAESLVISGSIVGGNGGTGDGSNGAGGAAVVGNDITIINSGTIVGGFAGGHVGDETFRANAITFTGGSNRLELQAGSAINGIVDATGDTDSTFALGGAANSSFDVSGVGSSEQYRGFEHFEKTGASTWTLTGSTTAVTPWLIDEGTLSISSDGNLGDASGGLILNGGSLATTAGFDSTRTVTLAGNGGFDVASGTELGLSGAISGDGDLVKQGAGALVLSGDNDFGNTLVEDGTLTGDASAISGHIGNAGTVVFGQGTDASFAGDIAGLGGTDGTMVKQSAGTLTLDGVSTLDWSVDNGGLTSAAVRFAGDVTIGTDGAFTFDQDQDATYSGTIAGNGLFSLDGGNTLLLTGDSSDFAGTTTINAGTLLVGDADGNGALGGSLDVLDGATLGGAGIVGSGTGSLVTVASGGTLAPGNSIGTQTVDGDLTFDDGSIFAVEVNPEGSEGDLVDVTGRATLNGGSVAHIGANGEYDLRSTYTILSAGTLDGEFDDVTSDFAFLNPDLTYDYDGGTVDLKLTRNDIDFASTMLTRNQIATAGGIESIGFDAGHDVYDAIAQLVDDEDLIRASFDALSGEIHASAQTALIEDSRFLRNAANDRIRAAFGDAGASVAPVLAYGPGDTTMAVAADHAGPVVWSSGFGSWGSTDSDGNAASLDRSTGGLLIGADTLVGDWRLGALAGYSHSRFDADDRASSGSSDNYHLGLYGGTQWGNVAFRTGAAYTWHDIETNRSVVIPGLSDSLSADYNAGTFQAFGELGYGINMGDARLEPFANLAHVRLHTDGFTEDGGAAALSSQGDDTDVTFTTLGVRGEHAMMIGSIDATLRGMLGWRHAFGDVTPESAHAFSAGDAFTIAGAPIARNSAVIEAGLDLNLTPEATFGLSYTGQIASDAYDHGFKVDLSVRF